MQELELPEELLLNAWLDGTGSVAGKLASNPLAWIHAKTMLPPPETWPSKMLWSEGDPPYHDWRNIRVGWSIVLPPSQGTDEPSPEPSDAPRAIQNLWEARCKPPIYRCSLPNSAYPWCLWRCARGEEPQPVHLGSSDFGTGPNAIPYYLLICGDPIQISWSWQYLLAARRAVGRLALADLALHRYVDHLLGDWSKCEANARSIVFWSVYKDEDRMTVRMHDAVATKLYAPFDNDADIHNKPFLTGVHATTEELTKTLARLHPGFVVTTSHGAIGTGAIADRCKSLGLPVDQYNHRMNPQHLKDRWSLGGSVWYAHACCSAGTHGVNRYQTLFAPESRANVALKLAAECGPTISPLPTSLLEADPPIRAFVGHVDPTFDWTIRDPATGQHLTSPLVAAFYDRFYQENPIPLGHALNALYHPLGSLYAEDTALQYQIDTAGVIKPPNQDPKIVRRFDRRITALDLQSFVLLGDPTVTRPRNRSHPGEQ
jgi:hypothetical protein